MELIQLFICKCVFVLTLFACHQILSIQARHLGQINNEESSKNSTNAFRPTTPPKSNSGASTNAFRPTTPPKPSSSASTKAFRPTTPPKSSSSASIKAFRPATPRRPNFTASTNAFRPTTPPQSSSSSASTNAFRPANPGKGHGGGVSFANENELVKQENSANGDRHFVAGNKEDFRPTSPGHSPGVGHAIGKNVEPNA